MPFVVVKVLLSQELLSLALEMLSYLRKSSTASVSEYTSQTA